MADTEGMAKTSTRSLWKGAITFGLVHIPIGLYSATEESDVDFDWLDRRTLDPVGYKRVNTRTGREIGKRGETEGCKRAVEARAVRAEEAGPEGKILAHAEARLPRVQMADIMAKLGPLGACGRAIEADAPGGKRQ